jgi:hypothetical protein
MTPDDNLVYFTSASTIRQFLELYLKQINERKMQKKGRDRVKKEIVPVIFSFPFISNYKLTSDICVMAYLIRA